MLWGLTLLNSECWFKSVCKVVVFLDDDHVNTVQTEPINHTAYDLGDLQMPASRLLLTAGKSQAADSLRAQEALAAPRRAAAVTLRPRAEEGQGPPDARAHPHPCPGAHRVPTLLHGRVGVGQEAEVPLVVPADQGHAPLHSDAVLAPGGRQGRAAQHGGRQAGAVTLPGAEQPAAVDPCGDMDRRASGQLPPTPPGSALRGPL